MCRRHVLEGLLRQVVTAEPTVELRVGCAVTGLLAEPSALAGVPRVVGVRTRDHTTITAQSVILAGGRHVPVAAWLRAIGAAEPEEISEGCGQLWYTRYFRVQPGSGEEATSGAQLVVLGDLGYMMFSIAGADQGTYCIELGVPTVDPALHAVHEQAVFMAALERIPMTTPWIAPERATPIGPLAAMGQEQNLLRRFVREERPLALGLHAIGDVRCRTNSVYAWGAGIALAEAVTLSDLLAEFPHDPLTQAMLFEERHSEDLAGWHHLAVERDRARLRVYRGESAWETAGADPLESFIQTVVMPATEEDAAVCLAATRQWTQLDPPGALARNLAVHERARELGMQRPRSAESPPPDPTREELLQILAATRYSAVRPTAQDA
jgi:2-polyprenyl-6-methoxyphenol hydroxylase-like FAD-dependent oxidoreductase